MWPKRSDSDAGEDLFRARLSNQIDLRHPLVRLARLIDWQAFERDFGPLYHETTGRPGKPIRLMVGLSYFKHAFDLSDEEVCARWVENPYWQYFCGFDYLELALPIEPSSLTRWRERIGPQGVERLLAATVAAAVRAGAVRERSLERISVDTTVQPKAVAHPLDSRLYLLVPDAGWADITGQASVVDGDTVEIHGRRIRLHGIDAPESSQLCRAKGKPWRCGQRAALALDDKIGRSVVSCNERARDRYGRIVAVCRAAGQDLNAWLVAQGWAVAYLRYSRDYVDEEEAARAAGDGVWRGRSGRRQPPSMAPSAKRVNRTAHAAPLLRAQSPDRGPRLSGVDPATGQARQIYGCQE